MSASSLVVLYRFSVAALDRNLGGITDAEALIPPKPAGNCVNWLVGHLLASRDTVHSLLSLPPAWSAELGPSAPYRRGATNFTSADAVSMTSLRQALGLSQEELMAALGSVSPSRLEERATDTTTVGERLAFLGFHEGYHVGQVGLLRRLLGKPGAIP